jgi:glycopeptide antibiotics resistance protein
MNYKKQNTLTIILFTIYLLLLSGVILFKLPFYSSEISDGVRVLNLIPLQGSFDDNGNLMLSELFLNTLIFIPFGIYISMFKTKWSFWKKVIPVFSLTVTFEVLQFIFAIGRSDITDVLDNTLGGIIGLVIYFVLFRILKDKTAKAINILALIATVSVVLRFAYLFYLSHFVMIARLTR